MAQLGVTVRKENYIQRWGGLPRSGLAALLWSFIGKALPTLLGPCPVSFTIWCLACVTFKWVTFMSLPGVCCMSSSVLVISVTDSFQGCRDDPFHSVQLIPTHEACCMWGWGRQHTESPSFEFSRQENKSPTPSYQGWHSTKGIQVSAAISREAEVTPERTSPRAFRERLPSLAWIRF